MKPRAVQAVVLVCGWMIAVTALACKVPVFRYALERWPVDRYRMVAIVDDGQSESVASLLGELQELSRAGANVDVEVTDLSKISEIDLWQMEEFDPNAETPRLQVFYPERNGARKKCWEGALTPQSASGWLDSPLRRQLAEDLIAGASAVWLLVEGTEKLDNDRLAEQVTAALEKAAAEIEIPEGVIPRQGANRYLSEHPEASMDDVLRSDVPLKVEFLLRRLSRQDVQESALLAMIDGLVETEREDQPLLVPIFGRGRMLDALPAETTGESTIINACRYMVGECSCTVKSLNPGVDLILDIDWKQRLGDSVVMIDPGFDTVPQLLEVPSGQGEIDTSEIRVEDRQPKESTASNRSAVALLLVSLAVVLVYVVRRVTLA